MTSRSTTSSTTTSTHNLTGRPILRPERRLSFSRRAAIGTVTIHRCEPLPGIRDEPPLAEHTARFDVLVPMFMSARLTVTRRSFLASALGPIAEWDPFALDELDLMNTPVRDWHLRRFASLVGLRFLDLFGTEITDDAGPMIGGLTGLEWLSLSFTRFGDAGVRALSGLDDLIRLSLRGTAITDAALDALADLPNLAWVSLADTAVTAEGVAGLLARAPRLERLAINGTPAEAARQSWTTHGLGSVKFFEH